MSTTRNVFVTGAASGIGEATARLFAANGWNVMVNARRQQCLEKLVSEFPAGKHLVCAGDFSCQETMDRAGALIDEAWGGQLDAVVSSAGLFRRTSMLDTPLEEWRSIFDIMVNGALLTTRLAAQKMKNGGKIVHVTSIHWNHAEAGSSAYSMAKAAMAQLISFILPCPIFVTSVTAARMPFSSASARGAWKDGGNAKPRRWSPSRPM